MVNDNGSPEAPKAARAGTPTDIDKKLVNAVDQLDSDAVRQLAAEGADVNRLVDGFTLLGRACGRRLPDLSVIEALLEAGADPDMGEQSTPIDLAAGFGHYEVVKVLLDAGANVHVRDAFGATPLMSAASNGDVDTVKLLLEAGADPNAVNDEGQNALFFAIQSYSDEAREILEPLTEDVESAAKPWRSADSIDSLENRFLEAAKGGDVEYVRRFLEEGVPVDAADETLDTALHKAAKEGHLDVVEELLAAGAPLEAPGCRDFTPLLAAANYGQAGVVRRLLEAGASVRMPDGTDRCSLYQACGETINPEVVDMLIAAGADPNAQEEIGMTALHAVGELGKHADGTGPDAVERLVKAGADFTIRDNSGWTPLMRAAMHADLPIVQKMIESGADPHAADKEGNNSLQLAERWGDPAVRSYLRTVL